MFGVFIKAPTSFPVANHLVVSVPFSREHGLSGSFNLPDFQAEERDSHRVSLVRSVNLLSYVVPGSKVHVRYDGSNLQLQGFRGLATRGRPLQNRVSLPQKGKVTDGNHLPSSFHGVAIADTGLPKKGSSRADADSGDVDISEKSRCAADAGSVGTEVAGKTRIADEDVGDLEVVVDMERIWPSVCSLLQPQGFESSPCVDKTVLPKVVPL